MSQADKMKVSDDKPANTVETHRLISDSNEKVQVLSELKYYQ